MTGFELNPGGRRCIRPILEAYQSGMDSKIKLFCYKL